MEQGKAIVTEVQLSRQYSFMYENFVVLTQRYAYLLLEKEGNTIFAIRFEARDCKYGGPNDEAHGAYPLAQNGLGLYGLYEVHNSPRIHELMVVNRIHPRHEDSLFAGLKHYIACFKDVKFECVCRGMEEVRLSVEEFNEITSKQLEYLAQ